MSLIESSRLLEERVKKAIALINKLRADNTELTERLQLVNNHNEELQELLSKSSADTAVIEEAINSALESLDELNRRHGRLRNPRLRRACRSGELHARRLRRGHGHLRGQRLLIQGQAGGSGPCLFSSIEGHMVRLVAPSAQVPFPSSSQSVRFYAKRWRGQMPMSLGSNSILRRPGIEGPNCSYIRKGVQRNRKSCSTGSPP